MNPSAQQTDQKLDFFSPHCSSPPPHTPLRSPPPPPPPPPIREKPQLYSLLLLLLCYFHAVYISVSQYKFCPACKRDQNINFKWRVLFQAESFPCFFCLFVFVCLFCFCFSVLLCPLREIRVALPGQGAATEKAALPIPVGVCSIFACPNNAHVADTASLNYPKTRSRKPREAVIRN